MRIATWNVNSVRMREQLVADWLRRVQPDLLLLQETKCEAESFPVAAFETAGYAAHVVGQKSYNGVAVLSRVPVEVTCRSLPGLPEDDAQARGTAHVLGEGAREAELVEGRGAQALDDPTEVGHRLPEVRLHSVQLCRGGRPGAEPRAVQTQHRVGQHRAEAVV